MLALDPLLDGREFGGGLLARHPASDATNGAQVATGTARRRRLARIAERSPDLHRLGARSEERLEIWRHHADHRAFNPAERNWLPHKRGIAVESSLPEPIADDGDPRRVGMVIRISEVTAQQRLDSQHAEEVRRHPRARKGFRLAGVRQGWAPIAQGGERVE